MGIPISDTMGIRSNATTLDSNIKFEKSVNDSKNAPDINPSGVFLFIAILSFNGSGFPMPEIFENSKNFFINFSLFISYYQQAEV